MNSSDVIPALRALGYPVGRSNSINAPENQTGIRAFQAAAGLVVDGIVGPRTRAALLGARAFQHGTPTPDWPEWFKLAVVEIGTREVVGRGSSARVIEYRRLGRTTDDMQTEDGSRPWCADFVNAMIELAGHRGSGSGMARSFERSTNFIRLNGPALGAIVTMWRKSLKSGFGHVYFYGGRLGDGRNAAVGGNQNDAVTVAPYSTERLVGYFWPVDAPLPAIGHVPAVVKPTDRAGRED